MSKASEHNKASPADLIESCASLFEANVVRKSNGELWVMIPLRRADGRIIDYHLTIDADMQRLTVGERYPRLLPAYCPERHINEDSTFCMNWQEVEPLDVTDEASAERWWGHLLQYLRDQERANQKRRWPSRRAWAHGEAAVHQKRAEECAADLGAKFFSALTRGRLKVLKRRCRGGRSQKSGFLQLMDGDNRIYSVWEVEKRVVTLRRRCICGQSRLPICACGDHARLAADLVFSLLEWEKAEKRFWIANKDKKCCGTMDGCPLAEKHEDTELAIQIAA